MSLIDIPGLPAIAVLKEEGRQILPLEASLTTPHKEVAILNLMPMKEQTERQLLRRMSMAEPLVQVTFLVTESYTPKHTPKEHLDAFYRYPRQIMEEEKELDGLIITGAPLEYIDYEDVTYWKELTAFLEWGKVHVGSVFYICWAAQAGFYYYYGIPKRFLSPKASGVFCHEMDTSSPISRGLTNPSWIPISRNTTTYTTDIRAVPELTLLSSCPEADVYLAVDEKNKRIFVTGHSEYEAGTLQYEYIRDIGRGLPVEIPKHYFKEGENPTGDPATWTPVDRWEGHSVQLWNNWFSYYATKPQSRACAEGQEIVR